MAQLYVAAAHSYQQTGKLEASQALQRELHAHVDTPLEPGQRLPPDLWFTKAEMYALAGETRPALISLQRAVDEGWTQTWSLRLFPVMQALRDEPDLQGILGGLQTRLSLMREQLELALARHGTRA